MQSMTVAPPKPRMTQGSFFVALFTNGLRVQGPLAAALREAGFDAARPKGEYPIEVWNECMCLAWRHVHPQQSQEPGEAVEVRGEGSLTEEPGVQHEQRAGQRPEEAHRQRVGRPPRQHPCLPQARR